MVTDEQYKALLERVEALEKRYYFSDADAIVLQGAHYVVCSQWDAKNIKMFLEAARQYYQIEEIKTAAGRRPFLTLSTFLQSRIWFCCIPY